ncbi:hypothetical protein O9992_00640 [Vibrio lentus]|nr:hypothetical protein [Vibrio lentus]
MYKDYALTSSMVGVGDAYEILDLSQQPMYLILSTKPERLKEISNICTERLRLSKDKLLQASFGAYNFQSD